MKRFEVIVSEQAKQQLVSHAAFLARVSPDAARKLTAAFGKAAHSLEAMPERCPWLRGDYIPRGMYRQLVFDKRYMLIFEVRDGCVLIDYVVDCRQDYGWLIE